MLLPVNTCAIYQPYDWIAKKAARILSGKSIAGYLPPLSPAWLGSGSE
jgi:hypothetical protein